MGEQLKLYVWHETLCDYTCGVIFAYAYSLEHAVELVKKEDDIVVDTNGLTIYETPMASVVWGGG